jgi:hypothetical protein
LALPVTALMVRLEIVFGQAVDRCTLELGTGSSTFALPIAAFDLRIEFGHIAIAERNGSGGGGSLSMGVACPCSLASSI